MRLLRLKEDFAALPANLSGWLDTNVQGILYDGQQVLFEVETQEASLREQIEELEAQVHDLENEALDAVTAAENARKDAEALRRELADLRDPHSGESVLSYRDRAVETERRCDEMAETVEQQTQLRKQAELETTALRKRKGVEVGWFAHAREALQVLARLEGISPEAANVLKKIRNHQSTRTLNPAKDEHPRNPLH